MKPDLIELNDLFDSNGEGIGVELKVNNNLLISFPNCHLLFHPMDQSINIVENYSGKLVGSVNDNLNEMILDNEMNFQTNLDL